MDNIGGPIRDLFLSKLIDIGKEDAYDKALVSLGCAAIAFRFDNCVITVWPDGGIIFETIAHYKSDFYKCQLECISEGVPPDDHANWDEFYIDLR